MVNLLKEDFFLSQGFFEPFLCTRAFGNLQQQPFGQFFQLRGALLDATLQFVMRSSEFLFRTFALRDVAGD